MKAPPNTEKILSTYTLATHQETASQSYGCLLKMLNLRHTSKLLNYNLKFNKNCRWFEFTFKFEKHLYTQELFSTCRRQRINYEPIWIFHNSVKITSFIPLLLLKRFYNDLLISISPNQMHAWVEIKKIKKIPEWNQFIAFLKNCSLTKY